MVAWPGDTAPIWPYAIWLWGQGNYLATCVPCIDVLQGWMSKDSSKDNLTLQETETTRWHKGIRTY